ncbi:hypothetical protein [Sphingomonas sp. PP-CE-1A-559]|uniref:hypothetical protein n=1 Tax=Sphingomonas sp. PP-CE-1A-559 TaxID=2135657 RepID=UPI00105478D8|nr:hypothetical protein [Sphingomonas sp. PP-CE-1A-559]
MNNNTNHDDKTLFENENLSNKITTRKDAAHERYLSLDAEPMSLEAVGLTDEIVHRVYFTAGRKYKATERLFTAVGATVSDLLAIAAGGPDRYGYRSMATTSFTGMHVGHASFKQVVDAMAIDGFVEVIAGEAYRADRAGRPGVATRFRATNALLEMALGFGVTPCSWAKHFQPLPRLGRITNPILLRSSSEHFKGKKLPGKAVAIPKGLSTVQALGETVNDINAFLARQDLDLGPYQHRFFQRIFSQGDCLPIYGWDKGGRLYSAGKDNYQQAPGDERSAFRFNGEATVEIDIGSSFLTIYRKLSGVEFDPVADPYDIPGLSRFASKSWVVMTFGHDRHHVRWPSDVKRKYQDGYEKHGASEWGTGDLQLDHPYRDTHALMLKALPELSEWATSPIRWGDLQYRESCAVVEVVHTLAVRYGIPALPVHDSIRVQVSARGVATRALSDAFQKHVGIIPIMNAK